MKISRHLRELAEGRVRPARAATMEMSAEDISRLVHELEIHQEELEIQNEELRRAHLELKESRDRYVDLFDFAPVGYLTLNAKGELVEANLTACELLGRARSQLIGTPLALYCDVESRAELRRHLNNVIATGQRQSTELPWSTCDGRYVRLETCRSETRDGGNHHCRTILTDISERKRAERAALEKDRHLRSLADALPVLISYLDSELRIQFCNAAFEDWFGAPSEQFIGARFQDAIGSQSQQLEIYFTDVMAGRRVDFESRLSHQRRGERQVQLMFVPDIAADNTVQGVHSLGIDITERKLIEQQNARRRQVGDRLVRLNSDEKKVYDLLVRGKSNKTIATQLDIGLRTAERRRQTVFAKLEVDSIAQLLQQLSDIQNVAPSQP